MDTCSAVTQLRGAEVQKQVLIFHNRRGPLVVSLERVSGALIGTHVVVSQTLAYQILERLCHVATEWSMFG